MALEVWLQRNGHLKWDEFETQAEADEFITENELFGWVVCDSEEIEENS